MRELLGAVALGVSLTAFAASTPAAGEDLRAVCARAHDDDALRPLPAGLAAEARRAFELGDDMTDEFVRETTVARCMGGRVWLCNAGANLICGKADLSRASPGGDAFCRAHPGAADIPMSATGHATIYEFHCQGRKAVADNRIADVDGRGFLADNWRPLGP